ncbi:MAG: enoyl-CoA hydratase-related protein [Steroidobacteraceae bacterium]
MANVLVEIAPPLCRVRLNRPKKRNAMDTAMWLELEEIATQIGGNTSVRTVVVCGSGDDAFSAGADIGEMADAIHDPKRLLALARSVQQATEAWAQIPQPTIAMIHGACSGGGCGLAVACDLRLAAMNATFAIPPSRLGLVYSLVDTRRLIDLVGSARTREMLLTGRRYDAATALTIGLVHEVVAARQLERTVDSLACRIAEAAPQAIRGMKRIINLIGAGQRLESPETTSLYEQSFLSAEFQEGVAAFVGKRKAAF